MENASTTTQLTLDNQLSVFRRKYRLEVVKGPDKGKSLTSSEARTSVGTAENNDLVLTDPSISRHHLRVEIQRDTFVLTDLSSTNGTRLGHVRVHQIGVVGKAVELALATSTVRFTPLNEEDRVLIAPTEQFGALLGASAPMRELFSQLEAVAARAMTVLIEGETGTGKELAAKEIHLNSPRRDGPFIVIDCGAIPATLIESELFGHTRGAFTHASVDRPGCFEEAHGGTIFLDEVGELELALQSRLLRVIERGEVKRVGEARHRSVDVRVVAATNRDLQRRVNEGLFRQDLFYRLAVARLRLPPLRERVEDIELLTRHLLADIAGGDTVELSADGLQQMKSYHWPGNVRELRNSLERLVVFPDTGDQPLATVASLQEPPSTPQISDASLAPFHQAKEDCLARFEREYLSVLLEQCQQNVAQAARVSGIARSHLFRLIKKHGLRESR